VTSMNPLVTTRPVMSWTLPLFPATHHSQYFWHGFEITWCSTWTEWVRGRRRRGQFKSGFANVWLRKIKMVRDPCLEVSAIV
jgi:hypothetical protein